MHARGCAAADDLRAGGRVGLESGRAAAPTGRRREEAAPPAYERENKKSHKEYADFEPYSKVPFFFPSLETRIFFKNKSKSTVGGFVRRRDLSVGDRVRDSVCFGRGPLRGARAHDGRGRAPHARREARPRSRVRFRDFSKHTVRFQVGGRFEITREVLKRIQCVAPQRSKWGLFRFGASTFVQIRDRQQRRPRDTPETGPHQVPRLRPARGHLQGPTRHPVFQKLNLTVFRRTIL